MMENCGEKQWFALYCKSRAEKKVCKELHEYGIESYIPLRTTIKQWSDRKKKVTEPIISGYVFVKISPEQKNNVFVSNGIVGFVIFEKKPAIIPEKQINILRRLLENNVPFEVTQQHFNPGDKVVINFGPLKDMQGEIQEFSGTKKVIIQLKQINYSLIVTLPAEMLSPVNERLVYSN